MEIGVTSFVETKPDTETGVVMSHAQRLREVVEEIVLADQVGLDVFGIGEHHRDDYAASSPANGVVRCGAPHKTDSIDKCCDGAFFSRSCPCVSGFCHA